MRQVPKSRKMVHFSGCSPTFEEIGIQCGGLDITFISKGDKSSIVSWCGFIDVYISSCSIATDHHYYYKNKEKIDKLIEH